MFADLARRGLQHPNAVAFVKRAVSTEAAGQVDRPEVPAWGVVLMSVTFWVAIISFYLVGYMLQEVLTTLCMVESPVAAITVSPSTHEAGNKEKKDTLLETGPTITLVNQKPITSSIRGTIRHLVAHAGRGARFRGIKIYMVHAMAFAVVASIFSKILPRFPGQPIFVAGLSGIILSSLHATWTHKVVSMPTDKSFCQRFRSASQFKTLALPAFIESAMPYISLYLTCGVCMLLGINRLDQENYSSYSAISFLGLAARLLAAFVFLVVCTLFLYLPAVVTLVRIEASILPEDQDTIVPFDRSFDGKVVSKLMGGTGKVAFLEAWRSFNWEARRRLIKLYIKSNLLLIAMMFIIAHVLLAEVFVVMGPAMGKFLRQASANGWVQ